MLDRTFNRRLFLWLFSLPAVYEAVGCLGSYLTVSLSRLFESAPIDYLETIFGQSALQVYLGQNLYPRPSMEYVGGMYNPLGEFIHALSLEYLGLTIQSLRIVDFAAFVVLTLLVWSFVYRYTRDPLWSFIMVVLLTSVDISLLHWFSNANVDCWFILFACTGFYLVFFGANQGWTCALAGVMFAASFFVKQTGVFYGLACTFHVFARSRRNGVVFLASMAVLGIGGELAMVLATRGWSWTYTFTLLAVLPRAQSMEFWHWFTTFHFPLALAFLVLYPLATFMRHVRYSSQRHERLFWGPLGLCVLLVAWQSYRKIGGFKNSLAPLYVYTILLLGVSRYRLCGLRHYSGHLAFVLMVWATLHVGFRAEQRLSHRLVSNGTIRPWRARKPRLATFQANLERAITEVRGNAYVGCRPFTYYRLTRRRSAHQTTVYNLVSRTSLVPLDEVTRGAIRRREYDAIFLWEWADDPLFRMVKQYYERVRSFGRDPLMPDWVVGEWRPRKWEGPKVQRQR